MADMAPALTEAATETHHRLKLAASSSASSPSATRDKDREPRDREPILPIWKEQPLLLPSPELNGTGDPRRRRRRPQNPARNGEGQDEGRPGGMEAPRGKPSSPALPEPSEPETDTTTLCPARAGRLSGRQRELEGRARRLCRRLQVIQAKQVERHVRQQLSGLVEVLGVAGLSGCCPQDELEKLAGTSTARLRAVQGGFDSDATESSSGGDSDSEQESEWDETGEGGGIINYPGDNRRADWRWAVERAAIICRWTWLQAQVSDLEFRIRQQNEIYKQIRSTKGSVLLGESPQSEEVTIRQEVGNTTVNQKGSHVSCSLSTTKDPSQENQCEDTPSDPSHLLHNHDKQCSRLTQSENVACQNTSTTPVSDSSGSQKSSHQVNGLINCVRSSLSCNGSADDVDPEGAIGKKRCIEGLVPSAALTDATCVAARTRPIRGYKKRRLVRSSAVSTLSRKPPKPLSMKCACEPPTTCILCGCKTYVKTLHPSTMTLNERIALLDPGYHPILSFPHDTTLNLHFESLLKEERQFRLTHKLKVLKLSQLGKKPLDRVRRDSQSETSDFPGYAHGRSDQEKLYRYRVERWQKNARLIQDSASEKVRSQLRRMPPTSIHSVGALFRDERQYKVVQSPSIHISSPVIPRSSSTSHQHPLLMETPNAASASQQNNVAAAFKRKRLENSYDINNIVIPMSMAAVARVEKLQYKEILTPSWRVLDAAEREVLFGKDPQLEDLSDESYLSRHSACEELERSRWNSWASTVPQRRGSRSSNKSDGRWTPQPSHSQGSLQPASPDIGFHSLNDAPLTLSSAAPDSPEPYSTVQYLSVRNRTRVLSWSEDTRSSTPEIPDEEEQIVQPWEPRTFPLSDRDQRALQNLPVTTPNKSRNKPDVMWHPTNKSSARTDSIDFGMSTENLAPSSKEPPLPNSISVVHFRAHSGEKIASLECFPTRPVNKR
ncbi:hypothetical protein GDO86_012013 [Hymenochirus boettgeri]|uniref:PEHE domain-containing protein n=1 Tax=Hymenochirus boettgeri TaxID=247094 RepID=A0A8T2JLR2_9PIPI|nr:hypothetical protein GDO86_012013 [Hymenochirus boettgeri]